MLILKSCTFFFFYIQRKYGLNYDCHVLRDSIVNGLEFINAIPGSTGKLLSVLNGACMWTIKPYEFLFFDQSLSVCAGKVNDGNNQIQAHP